MALPEVPRPNVRMSLKRETNGKTILKYWGPDLHKVNAKAKGMFRHDAHAGDMFINAIGDVHLVPYTKRRRQTAGHVGRRQRRRAPGQPLLRHSDFLSGRREGWD